jgi:parallel beta-helix repeat protein
MATATSAATYYVARSEPRASDTNDGLAPTEAADCTVRGNQIYLCKKEGIRDYGGYGNLIESNIIYGCTYGISLNATRGGTRVLNNYISKVIHGYNPKHTTGEHGWNVFWHNTVYDSAYWAVSIGSPPTGDFVDVRNNIFARSGEAHVMHAMDATGPNLRIDGNLHYMSGTRPQARRLPAASRCPARMVSSSAPGDLSRRRPS